MIQGKFKTSYVITLAMTMCLVANIAAIEVLGGCGHTQKKRIGACPANNTCGEKTGGPSLDCTNWRHHFNQQPGDFGSEGCGECKTEAQPGPLALCANYWGCNMDGLGNCGQAAGNPSIQNSNTLVSNPCP